MIIATVHSMRTATVMLVVALIAGCGSSDPDIVVEDVDLVDDVPACTSFDGMPTIEVAEYFDSGQPCGVDRALSELQATFLGVGDRECDNGTFLYWNDAGWGPSDGTWTSTTEGLPPTDILDRCTPTG